MYCLLNQILEKLNLLIITKSNESTSIKTPEQGKMMPRPDRKLNSTGAVGNNNIDLDFLFLQDLVNLQNKENVKDQKFLYNKFLEQT